MKVQGNKDKIKFLDKKYKRLKRYISYDKWFKDKVGKDRQLD